MLTGKSATVFLKLFGKNCTCTLALIAGVVSVMCQCSMREIGIKVTHV